jgi:hypothetical protein
MDEYECLSHTIWDYKYHVVFIPKCRRRTLYQELRRHLGEVFPKLALQKDSKVEEGHLMPGQRIQVNKSAALGVECVFAVEARVQETRGACNSAVFPERTSASYETSRRRRKRQRHISYASLT